MPRQGAVDPGEVGIRQSVVRTVPASGSAGGHGRSAPGTAPRRPDRGLPPPEATPLSRTADQALDVGIDEAPAYGDVLGPEDVGGEIDERVRHGGVGPVEDARRGRGRRRRSTDGSRHGPASDRVRSRRGAGTTRPSAALWSATGSQVIPDSRPSSAVSSVISSTCAARSVSDRTGSPRATSSSVRPSHDCWIPAWATTPSCHSDSSWSPSSAAPRSRISIQPRGRRRRSPPVPAPASARPGPASRPPRAGRRRRCT